MTCAIAGTARVPPASVDVYQERGGAPLMLKKEVVLTGENLTDAQAGFDSQNPLEPAVHLTIGIVFGIYSSIFVMSPITMRLGIKREDLVKPVKPKGSTVGLTRRT